MSFKILSSKTLSEEIGSRCRDDGNAQPLEQKALEKDQAWCLWARGSQGCQAEGSPACRMADFDATSPAQRSYAPGQLRLRAKRSAQPDYGHDRPCTPYQSLRHSVSRSSPPRATRTSPAIARGQPGPTRPCRLHQGIQSREAPSLGTKVPTRNKLGW
jgi:hypothetical protein